MSRADSQVPNMGLTSWKGNKVQKQDIVIAKNYLSQDELDTLNRLTVIFLETAELRVKERKDINLNFWRNNVDRILQFNDKSILQNAGAISNALMEEKVKQIYFQFDQKRKQLEAEQADLEDLKTLEERIKKSKK
jgi:hypothetical protein